MRIQHRLASAVLAYVSVIAAGPDAAQAQTGAAQLGEYGGNGIRTSLLATYVREGEIVFYPFYEYTRTSRFQYKASDFGYIGETDFSRGKLVEHEYLLYIGYAPTDSLLFEFESALHAKARFTKAPEDTTALPGEIRESGLGDTEMEVRWRYAKESATRPDIVLFLKTVFPLQKKKRLLGTHDWQFGTGVALTKAYSFGTMVLRGGVDYDRADRKLAVGEWGLDYMTRLGPQWRLALSLEGHETKPSVIGELQYAVSPDVLVKLNSAFGLSRNDRAFAPEIGVMFRF